MSRRVLVLEPDPGARARMNRTLGGGGYAVDAVASLAEARPLLEREPPVELVIADEIGAQGAVLEDVRTLRQERPAIPLMVTGVLLSPRVLRELLRLRVSDALPKPFTPDDLREAVARAIQQATGHHEEALEYAAAIDRGHRAIVEQRLAEATCALRRAHAVAPLDTEAMALLALVAELEGRDCDADRAYRAAIALRDDEDVLPPDPHEGLARLEAYGGAVPVGALSPAWANVPRWIVSNPGLELRSPPPEAVGPCVVMLSLGLCTDGPEAVFYRDEPGPGTRAFALVSGAMHVESLALALARMGEGPIVAAEPTRAVLDLARLAALRAAAVTPKRA